MANARRILVLANPRAGGGGAASAADELEARLRAAGHDAARAETRGGAAEDPPDDVLRGREALVVVGGDGAVRAAIGPAVRTGVPVYHVPRGTENLFAREFGMDAAPESLLRALRRFDVRRIDAGEANGSWFGLMVSAGFDAAVVHDLAERRGGRISHLSYLGPMRRQLARYEPAGVTVTVDGRRVVEGRRGEVIVANSGRYAWRLDPARRADVGDGLLDIVFLPTRGRLGLLAWIARCAAGGRHLRHPRLVYERGADVRITLAEPRPMQLDGDPPPGRLGGRESGIRVAVRPASLGVLLPV